MGKSKLNPRYRNPRKRNEMRRRVLAVYDNCAICGQPVDKTLPAGHPLAPEVDEIIPISKGGSPVEWENLQLAHRICNQRRGAKPMSVMTRPERIKTSRRW